MYLGNFLDFFFDHKDDILQRALKVSENLLIHNRDLHESISDQNYFLQNIQITGLRRFEFTVVFGFNHGYNRYEIDFKILSEDTFQIIRIQHYYNYE